jgi:SulP family sulfate permease
MVRAALLFMRRMAEVPHTRLADASHPDLPGPLPPGVVVYEISGPLFFGAAQKAMAALEIVAQETRVVVLLMDEVHAMDATGLVALESAIKPLSARKCLTILSGVRAQPSEVIRRGHVGADGSVVFSATAREALDTAARYVEQPTA